MRLAGLLALVLGMYVIFHTLSMSLVERVREVGLLHALGTTRSAIARVFFVEAVAIAGAGTLLGLAGGIALARALLAVGVSTVGTGRGRQVTGFDVPWGSALGLCALGFAVALAGSVYPLARARSADTSAALRGEQALADRKGVTRGFSFFAALLVLVLLPGTYFAIVPVIGRNQGALVGAVLGAIAAMALLLVVPLLVPSILSWSATRLASPFERRWPLAGRLAARGMQTGRTRVAFSVAAVALVVAAFVSLRNMTASLSGEVESWASRSIVDKLYVENLADVPIEVIRERLEGVPGVLGIEVGSTRTHGSFLLLGTPIADLAKWGPLADRPESVAALARGEGIVLSTRLAQADGWQEGDLVPMTISMAAYVALGLSLVALDRRAFRTDGP